MTEPIRVNPFIDTSRPFRLVVIDYSTGLEVVELWYRGIRDFPNTCIAHWSNHPDDKFRSVNTFELLWQLGAEETGYTNRVCTVDLTWADLERPVMQTLLETRPFTTVAWLKPIPAGYRPPMARKVS